MSQPNQLAIQIRLEGSNQVVTAVQQVQSQFSTFQQTLQAGFNLNVGAKLADALLQSVGAIRQAIGEGLRYAAGLKDMSIQSGLTVEAVQVLGQSAAQSGAGIENVRTALTNLRQAATAAQQGNVDLSAAFAQLGLDAEKITQLPLEGQLEAVARGFAATGHDGRSFSALVRLLGERDAPRLQGMLQELAQNGLGGMAKALRENGALLDSELIDKADDLDDKWGALGTKFKATFAGLGILLAPFINGIQWLVGKALDGLNLVVNAFRNLATAMGAIAAVIAGADWKTAWQEFLNTANGAGPSSGPAQANPNTPGPAAKPTGPTIAEMAAEQQRLLIAQQPLWQQRESASAAVARAEQALQLVMAEGNAKQQVDIQALAAASLAVTKAKAGQAEVETKITAELTRQLEQSDQIAKLEASFGPIAQQRAVAQTTLADAEAEVARLNASAVLDANALLAAELKRLGAKRELADLDAALARTRADQGNQAALDAADATTRQLAAKRATLEGDFTRTAQDKWAERKRILAEEIANQQSLHALLIAKRDAAKASGDSAGEGVYDQSARAVSTGVAGLQNQQSSGGPDPSSMGQQLTAAITAAQSSVGSFAEQIGRAFSSVGDSIRTNLGGALSDMIMKGASFKEAMLGFGQAIANSFVNTGAQMVADWIYSHVIMSGVRSAFHAMGIETKAAAVAVETTIHGTGEVAQTAMTGTGAGARSGIRLGETIFHGLQVGLRVAGHLAGELLMTGISVIQAAIRLPLILMETGAWLVKAAIQAISALSVIPVIGPFLGIAAAAAILAAGANIMSKGFAEGGLVEGPGSGTSDSIPARLSNGEFVMKASAVRALGPDLLEGLNSGTLDRSSFAGAHSSPAAQATASAGGAGAAAVQGGGTARESVRNNHFFIDREVFAAAMQQDMRAVAHEVYLSNVRKGV